MEARSISWIASQLSAAAADPVRADSSRRARALGLPEGGDLLTLLGNDSFELLTVLGAQIVDSQGFPQEVCRPIGREGDERKRGRKLMFSHRGVLL
jgi:hypothetical protein